MKAKLFSGLSIQFLMPPLAFALVIFSTNPAHSLDCRTILKKTQDKNSTRSLPSETLRFKKKVSVAFRCVHGEMCSPIFLDNFRADLAKSGINLENIDATAGGVAGTNRFGQPVAPSKAEVINLLLQHDYLFVVNQKSTTQPVFDIADQLSSPRQIKKFLRKEKFKNRSLLGKIRDPKLEKALENLAARYESDPSWTPPLKNALTTDALLKEMGILEIEKARGKTPTSVVEAIIANEGIKGNIAE